jgi:hypothetical protein
LRHDYILQKTLTANDLGLTGSHQAGIHVPRGLADFFPTLDRAALNPSVWLEVLGSRRSWRWRWIYYNNAVIANGTRDEFRLTRTTAYIRDAQADVGDILELAHVDGAIYQATLQKNARSGVLVLRTDGTWRSVAIRTT